MTSSTSTEWQARSVLRSGSHAWDVLSFLRRATHVAPGRLAVSHPDVKLSYAQLHDRVDAVARALPPTGAGGEAVLVVAEHDPQVPELYLGVMAAGHAVVPVSARLPAEQVAQIAERAGARIGIVAPSARRHLAALSTTADWVHWQRHDMSDRKEHLSPPSKTMPPGTAMVCFTSGTTGAPKGVVLTHENLFVHGLTAAASYGMRSDDVHVNPMPLAHFAGASRVILATVTGGTHVIVPGFSAEAVTQAINRCGGTHLMVVPTMAADLLAADADPGRLSTLRRLIYGAATMPMELARDLVQTLNCGLVNGYGLTESSALATALGPRAHLAAVEEGDEELLSSVGQAVPGVELAIVDEDHRRLVAGESGQIALRGPKVSPGYLDAPELNQQRFAPDGWLLTGDQGRLLPGDNLRLLGRMDEMLISGGLNIHPGEIEKEAARLSGVVECAAFGIQSARWGTEVRLAVVAADGAELDEQVLRDALRARLDRFKVPKQVHLVDSLPRTSVGKLQRFQLAERFGPAEHPTMGRAR